MPHQKLQGECEQNLQEDSGLKNQQLQDSTTSYEKSLKQYNLPGPNQIELFQRTVT